MSTNDKAAEPQSPARSRVSADVLAVLLALALVAMVRLGWLPVVGW